MCINGLILQHGFVLRKEQLAQRRQRKASIGLKLADGNTQQKGKQARQASVPYTLDISGVLGNPITDSFSTAVSHRPLTRCHTWSTVVKVGIVLRN